MICPTLTVDSLSDAESLFARLKERFNPDDGAGSVEKTVKDILADVSARGLEAVVDYTRKFDSPDFLPEQFAVSQDALAEAASTIDAEDRRVILEAIANIRSFHEHQREKSWMVTREDGTVLGQMVRPVDRAGLYIPAGKGGLTPLISSAMMNAIPAQVAGVKELVLISPPMQSGEVNPYILATAHLLGIDKVYAAGSAWGIGALAYGAGDLAPVDVIAGPGNIFVATAKRLLIGTVGIDMLAGPSEILILADKTANAAWAAADMLSQAEHDALAAAICITDSPELATAIMNELATQCEELPRADIAKHSLLHYGGVVLVPSMAMAIEMTNDIAAEHLELLVEDPWSLLPHIRHAGAIFMGHQASEPLGDYYAGTNHVLPTMGNARFSSALGVDVFMKKSSIIAASAHFARQSAGAVARLARIEGLEAHARSALCRAGMK